jgi:hypothetical protein
MNLGEQAVEYRHLKSTRQQLIGKVRSNKSGTAGYQHMTF